MPFDAMALVSVVIPTHNRFEFTSAALESVFAQSYRDVEIIVVDDNSKDGTPKRLAEKYGERIKLLRLLSKQERSMARNTGWREARGEFVAFLDSDDVWLPDKLARQVALFENPDVGLVHGLTDVIDEAARPMSDASAERLRLYRDALRRGYDYLAMSERCIMFTSTIVVRRTLLEELGGYDKDMPTLEDWDLYLRVSLNAKIATVNEVVAHYRQHSGGTANADHAVGRMNVCRKHLSLLAEHPDASFVRRARRNFYLNLAATHCVCGQAAEAGQWMRKAARLDPSVLLMPLWRGPALCAVLPVAWIARARGAKAAFTK